VVVGPREGALPEDRCESLAPPAGLPGPVAARAEAVRPRIVRLVGIDPLLDRPGRQLQDPPPQGALQGLDVERFDRVQSAQGRELLDDLRLEGRRAPPFRAAAGVATAAARSWASHSLALTSISSRVRWRKRRYSASCACVRATAGPPGMTRVTVFPSTARVNDQLGPCPTAPAWAQWQPGFPHFRYRPTRDPGRRSPTAARLARTLARRCSRS
jgi:hypothetical protein